MIEKTEGKNEWTSEPLNMGLPINSQNNDYALCDIDGVTGYFTSEEKVLMESFLQIYINTSCLQIYLV